MRAVIYARYSSEGQREASIEDQFRNCERYAQREGWTITARYSDKAISGTQDEAGRPGYKTMLDAARAKQFDVLLVDDLSRLSRDSVRAEEVRRLFVFLKIRLIGISDGIDSAAKGSKLLSSVKGIMNDVFLDDLREKTHRGLAGQALRGNNTGGRAYGYKHVPVEHPTEKDEYGRPVIVAVQREIDPAQARWVTQIFEWVDAGKSKRQITNELNRLKVPSPGASYRRRNPCARYGTWSISAVHSIVTNPLYFGRMIWNRRKWVLNPETKRRVPEMRPKSEWIVVARPELCIVSEDLWRRVEQRRKEQKPKQPRAPKYILSGLLKCEVCGSNFTMSDYYRYACAGHRDRGASVCSNSLRVPRALVEEKTLASLKSDLFSQEGFDLFLKETTRLLTERTKQRPPKRDRLAEVEREIANLLTAIKAGILTSATKTELEKLETERIRLQQVSEDPLDNVLRVLPDAKARYQKLIEGIGSLSTKHISQAREQIRTLVGEIWLKPSPEGYLVATLTGRYEGLVKLLHAGKTRLNLVGCGERI